MMTARRNALLGTIMGLLPALIVPPAAAQVATQGDWHDVFDLDIQPIFVTLLEDGRVLCLQSTFGYSGNNDTDTILLDLNHASYPDEVTIENWANLQMTNIAGPGEPTYNFSCSSFAQLPSGNVVFIGGQSHPGAPGICGCYNPVPNFCIDGHNLVAVFDPAAAVAPSGNPWDKTVDKMKYEGDPLDRWYPPATTLGDGTILATSGRGGDCQSIFADMPAVFDPTKASNQQWDVKSGALWPGHDPDDPRKSMAFYPRMILRSNGEMFYASARNGAIALSGTWRLNLGTEKWTKLPDLNFGDPGHAKYRGATSATFYRRSSGGSWVQHVLKAGGRADDPGPISWPQYFGDQVEQIKLTDLTPVWADLAAMNVPRDNFYVVPLPDGRILAVGGNTPVETTEDANYDYFDRVQFPDVLPADLYNPETNVWDSMASLASAAPRRHHSVALLLPDGRVMTAGGQHYEEGGSGPLERLHNLQIYSPPYLYNSDGTAADRPEIDTCPDTIEYNKGFDIITQPPDDASSITKVSLVRLGTPTHSFDHATRYLPLEFVVVPAEPTSLRIVPPPHGNIAPPGHYMLFILKLGNNGTYEIPSMAEIVELG